MGKSYTVHFAPDALDLSLLPEGAREPGTDAFAAAVSDLIGGDLSTFGLDGSVTVTAKQISITWQDVGAQMDGVKNAVALLREGDYQRGVRMLKILEPSNADDPNLHFNLGAALSDLQRYDEAREHLNKALAIDSDHTDARTTLGLTYAREQRLDEAIPVFEEASKRDPQNPYVWRALGRTLRLIEARLPEAEAAIQNALELQAQDPISWLGLGEIRESLGKTEESIDAFKRCLGLNPSDGVAGQAEAGINRHTNRELRPADGDGKEMLRMDAVMYMQEVLTQISKMSDQEVKLVAQELALAGQKGLNLKDSETTYELETLPGKFTAMKIVSSMYAVFQQITHGADMDGHFLDLINDIEHIYGEWYTALKIGKQHRDNGTSLAMAMKCLEQITGDTLPALYKKHLFDPLGCEGIESVDAAAATHSNAIDLARVGQMLANRGAYGDKRFFSEETFERMLPKKLTSVLGNETEVEWGIGLVHMVHDGLSKQTIGHGSASSSTFRVDLETDLVITMVRPQRGSNYGKYFPKFIRATTDAIVADSDKNSE